MEIYSNNPHITPIYSDTLVTTGLQWNYIWRKRNVNNEYSLDMNIIINLICVRVENELYNP